MVDKKYEHLTMKEKTEAIKKTLNLFDLTDEGARKRGIFFLSTMKTFNLVLAHNKYEIFTFFDPNGFCSSLALAKEITFYLTTYIRDRDFLEEVSDRSFQTVGDFELVARILAELYKLFIGRLEYKEANEQSKEFLNTYIIDSIFLMFEIVHRPKFAEGVNQVLLKSLLLYSQKIFQLICSLVGSFDFLLKHILERVLATSLNEAVYLKVLSFCLRACYPTEGRKKFLDIVRNTMIEIKVKELKPLQNELHIHYGSEPLLNMILSLKETYRISNCLEYIIYRGISIRDQERKLALIEVLDALSKFGEFPILLCVTRYIAGRIQNEERILSESGRATRELSNTLELMANLTQNPFYKSMFLSEEIMRYLNPVLKHLLASKFKESEFPVLQVYQNLLDIKVSLNNTKEEMKKSKDADGLVDRISKDHLSDMVRHLADHLTLEGVSDSDSDEEQNKLKVQASILKTLQKFFDANYYDSLCLKELSKGEDSRICIFIKSVISTMNSSKFAGLVAGCSKEFEDIATSLFQIMVSLVYPTWLTRDTYRTKRIKSIGVLIGNDKDIDRSKEVGNALLSSAAKVFGEFSSAYIGMKCLFDVYIDTVYKKEEILQSLYKSSPVYKEEDLVKKKSFYETPFERNYRLEWDNDKKIPEVTKDIIEALSNLNEPKQLKYAEFEQFGPNPELEFTFETTPITSFDLSASKPSSTGSKFVDGKIS